MKREKGKGKRSELSTGKKKIQTERSAAVDARIRNFGELGCTWENLGVLRLCCGGAVCGSIIVYRASTDSRPGNGNGLDGGGVGRPEVSFEFSCLFDW